MSRFCLLLDRKDVNRPAKLIALDMIRVATGYAIRPNKIKLVKAEELDQRPDLPCDENSFVQVVIDTTEDTRFAGETGFAYRRLTLDEVARANEIKIDGITQPFKVEDILAQINEQLETQFTLEDLNNDIEYDPEAEEFRLYANPGSFAFVGNTLFSLGEPEKLNLLSVTELVGFTPSETYNYAGLSTTRLVRMLEQNNPVLTSYRYGVDYMLSEPRVITPVNGRNTEITFIPTSPRFNQQTLTYRRLSLSNLNPDNTQYPQVVFQTFPATTHGALAQINTALGLNLTAAEVENVTYNEFVSEFELRVVGPASSVAWTASMYKFRAGFAGRYRVTSQNQYRMLAEKLPRVVSDAV